MTKISNLEERVNQLNEGQEPSLTTEEANTVRWFWIHRHWTVEEAEEYTNIQKRGLESSFGGLSVVSLFAVSWVSSSY
jgi:hypothetical protein